MTRVALIMGSKTDLGVMKSASLILTELGIKFHIEIISAHRTPRKMYAFAQSAKAKGFQVIIAGAGGSAHLPGMVAALTELPVIGVPVSVNQLKGLDSLLSIVQMPKGVPVATVAIDNAFNAGLLAAKILALHDSRISKSLDKFSKKQKNKVFEGNKGLRKSK